jgi:hypothetical protein
MVHGPEGLSTINVVMDIVLVLAGLWMVWVVRGIGGIVGSALTLIVTGAIILGFAHLITTLAGAQFLNLFDATLNNFIHRLIVLIGFVVLVFGFRRLRVMKD